ncbi:MAG TPA: hypothetical protein VMI32_17370 [Candidatus Solibacter sp.]|nr:hypothetical protein [Candidatus Solibacter sp.]
MAQTSVCALFFSQRLPLFVDWNYQLEIGQSSCPVPQVQDFNHPPGLVNLIINHDRAVHELPNLWAFANGRAYEGKLLKELQMVQKGVAETSSSLGIIFGDAANDFSQIA